MFPALLAFAVAALFCGLELVTSNYPRTIYFLRQSRHFYAYLCAYGLLAACAFLCLGALESHGILKLEGFIVSNAWMRAVALGASTKALLHIRLFSVGVGGEHMPVGTETIIQLFEPWLLEEINLHEFSCVRDFLEPWKRAYPEIAVVRANIISNIPSTLSGIKRTTFEATINKRGAVPIECMEYYLRRFGVSNFRRAFPLPERQPVAPTAARGDLAGER